MDLVTGVSYQDLKNPQRLNSPQRVQERKRYFDTQKIDDNHYQITKTQLYIGYAALAVLFISGVKSSLKELRDIL